MPGAVKTQKIKHWEYSTFIVGFVSMGAMKRGVSVNQGYPLDIICHLQYLLSLLEKDKHRH